MDAEAVYNDAMAVFISALAADINEAMAVYNKAAAVCKKTREDFERAKADCNAAWVVVESAMKAKSQLVRPPEAVKAKMEGRGGLRWPQLNL